jgi:hypothetical protein
MVFVSVEFRIFRPLRGKPFAVLVQGHFIRTSGQIEILKLDRVVLPAVAVVIIGHAPTQRRGIGPEIAET